MSTSETLQPEKIQKVLARAGIGSRRQIETYIQAGRIHVNQGLATLGDRLAPNDIVHLDGKLIPLVAHTLQETRVLLYHKPVGKLCTRHDQEGRPTIFERFPVLQQGRWISIGRLDYNTSGLLLLTNDGDLANRLMHPSSNIEREYAVRVSGNVTPLILKRLQMGVKLEDGFARFHQIKYQNGSHFNQWYHVIVHEGRNRIVRRLWESQQMTVSRLMRIRFGHLQLPRELLPDHYWELTHKAIKKL